MNLNGNGIHEKFIIEHNWGILEIKKALVQKYGKEVGESFFGVPIYFSIAYKVKQKDNDNKEMNVDLEYKENGFKENIIKSLGNDVIIF